MSAHCQADPVQLRPADVLDVDVLMALCRECFPRSARWQGPRAFARRWWSVALGSDIAKVWLCLDRSRPAGFCVLVTDELCWNARKRQTAARMRDYGGLLLSCPLLSVREAVTKARLRLGLVHCDPAETPGSGPAERTWIEMLCVGDRHRRRGLAGRMLRLTEDITLGLGKRAIGLRVETHNQSARSLYERCGYALNRRIGDGCIYIKMLSQLPRDGGSACREHAQGQSFAPGGPDE